MTEAIPRPNKDDNLLRPQPKTEPIASIKKLHKIECSSNHASTYTSLAHERLPRPSKRRQSESLLESPFDLEAPPNTPLREIGGGSEVPKTVFYLAYGSNLCRETFQGRRGIKPLSAVNVVVPQLVMTFDLAGIPYTEPCFANSRYRNPSPTIELSTPITPSPTSKTSPKPSLASSLDGASPRDLETKDYHKTRWHKGMVGVVYEVTLQDYTHIIATEGGGSAYQDVLVDCYELPLGSSSVPEVPTTQPFKAHTLYSPLTPHGIKSLKKGSKFARPDPNYAQPSARYLKLITDGADEHDIPQEYKNYLHQLRPYTITTLRQRIGGTVFRTFWMPVIFFVFSLNKKFADDKGRAPAWLNAVSGAIFSTAWVSYDNFFKHLFGDGERTIGQSEDDDAFMEGTNAKSANEKS